MRIWVESSSGLHQDARGARRFGGLTHIFIDCTDRPAPAIVAGRSVQIAIERDETDVPLWFCQIERQTGRIKRRNLDELPMWTICAQGTGDSVRADGYWLEGESVKPETAPSKPPYRVPPMSEIAALPWNGFSVVSTFAGCGGSSTGYRMAGFRIVWANEFVPAALDSYRANMAATTVLDGRPIQTVAAEDILAATGLKVGELDLLDGSPPCQAFSTAGSREEGWGKDRTYEQGAKQKNEELFTEFIRLVDGLKPKVFVAENVSGLIKGVAKGFFIEILKALKACGYRVEAQLLDAQWLGVPQARQRVIFIGVRNDLGISPVFPKPLKYRYSIRDALPWIGGLNMGGHGFMEPRALDGTAPSPTIASSGMTSYRYDVEDISVVESRHEHRLAVRPFDEPSPAITANGAAGFSRKQVGIAMRIVQGPQVDFRNEGREVPLDAPSPSIVAGDAERRAPRQFEVETRVIHDTRGQPQYSAGDITDRPAPAIMVGVNSVNATHFQVETRVIHDTGHDVRNKDITDRPCATITVGNGNSNHYRVEKIGARVVHDTGGFVRDKDVTDQPCPTITAGPPSAADGGGPRNHFKVEEQVVGVGGITDTGFSGGEMTASVDHPSPTIMAGGGGGMGRSQFGVFTRKVEPEAERASAIERRQFTIAELRRICSFSDDFILTGTYAQQWERLGNSVPPVMMAAIATAIRDGVLRQIKPLPEAPLEPANSVAALIG